MSDAHPTDRRAVAVARDDAALAACARHCIDADLILSVIAPTVEAALDMLLRGEVDVVVLPGDDGHVPVQVAGQVYRQPTGPAPLRLPTQRQPLPPPDDAVPPTQRRPRGTRRGTRRQAA